MNDNTKTMIFVVVAVAALAVAWASRPTLPDTGPDEAIGQLLVEEFSPLDATSLEILEYDEDKADVQQFQVAQVDGVWSIPSHDNYPADAKDHLAEAATGLLNRKILSVVSTSPGQHATYGVIRPDPQDPKNGMGTLVTMKDKDDKPLLSLVIGKQVPDRTNLRYVRRADEDPVYTAELSTDKLSTKFEDWIEKDLLKMSTFDIKNVQILDYSLPVVIGRDGRPGRAYDARGRIGLAYDNAGDPKWKMVQDEAFEKDKWVPRTMAEDEELNTSKLDDMRFALDDLKIVDVRPKPTGLSADLKAGEEFLRTNEALESLASRGFYPARVGDGFQLYSSDGEVHYLMKDGVRYILRFGGIASTTAAKPDEAEEKKKDDADPKEKDSTTANVNRFLFVTCEFDPSVIELPKPEPLPEAKPEEKPEAKPEAKPEEKPEAKPEEKPETKPDELKAERERIEKDNKRKQEEYDGKLAEGKKHVEELNRRFADWYYVIPDSAYQKIHLGRPDVVKKKEKKEEEKKAGPGEMPGPIMPPGDTPTDFEDLKGKLPAPTPEPPAAKPAEPAPKPEPPAAKPAEPAPKP